MAKNKLTSSSTFNEPELQDIEIPLLLEAIYQRWGYDFRDYSPASLKRRILRILEKEELASVSYLQQKALRDPDFMRRFIEQLTVSVTSMFRDPDFYLAFRTGVVPLLKRRDGGVRIWHAGCSSGEEVYSIAILLHEEGLLDKTRIYATDISQDALETAKAGIYPLEKMKEYSANYHTAGGKAEFSAYYYAAHGSVAMSKTLMNGIVWAQHNLVTDASFNEFDLILCRNVLIYFNTRLQARVHRLFYDSLALGGLLALGKQETLQITLHEHDYRALDNKAKIYQRVT